MASGKAKAPVRAPTERELFFAKFAPAGSSAPTDVDTADGFAVARTGTGTYTATLAGVTFRKYGAIAGYTKPPANGAVEVSGITSTNGSTVVTIKTLTSGAAADHAAVSGQEVNLLFWGSP
jgi:hypothetical protein